MLRFTLLGAGAGIAGAHLLALSAAFLAASPRARRDTPGGHTPEGHPRKNSPGG